MKTKIEIKSVTGEVLFSCEKEDNTIKKTVEEAARNGVNLDGAYLRGTYLRGAYLNGISLDGANLSGAYLDNACLEDVNLRGANLCGTYLRGTYLRRANLRRANLEDAYLRGANLTGANLTGAYLNGAYFDGAFLSNVYVRDGLMLSGVNGIFTVGAIGIVIYNTDKGLYVQCGRFFDAIEEFVTKVQGMHDKAKSRFYMALVDLAKTKYNENN